MVETFRPQWRELVGKASYIRDAPVRKRLETLAGKRWKNHDRGLAGPMARLFKALVFLMFVGFLGLVGYSYLGDLAPEPAEVRQPVELNAGN
jgi:hypothetical protein